MAKDQPNGARYVRQAPDDLWDVVFDGRVIPFVFESSAYEALELFESGQRQVSEFYTEPL